MVDVYDSPNADAENTPRVRVVAPDGKHGMVDVSEMPELTKRGFRLETQDEFNQYLEKQSVAGVAHGVKAAAVGAFRECTLGFGSQILKSLGADTELLRRYEKHRPTETAIGGGIGLVGSALATGGIAGGVGKWAAGKLLSAATKKTLAKQIAASAVGYGAVGAAESSLYGVGQAVDEAVLEDKELTAELIAANVKSAILFGGGAGVAFGALGPLVKSVRPAAAAILKKAAKTSEEAGDGITTKLRRELSIRGTGATQSRISKLGKRYDEVADELTKPQEALSGKTILHKGGSRTKTLENIETVKKSAGKDIALAVQNLDTAASSKSGVMVTGQGIADRIRKEVIVPMQEFAGYKNIQSQVETLAKEFDDIGDMTFHKANKQKQMLYDLIEEKYNKAKQTPLDKAKINAVRIVREEIENKAKALSEATGNATLLDNFLEANRKYGAMETLVPLAKQGVARSLGNNIFGMSEMFGGTIGATIGGIPGAVATALATKVIKERGLGVAAHIAKTIEERSSISAARKVAVDSANELGQKLDKFIKAVSFGAPATATASALIAAKVGADTTSIDSERVKTPKKSPPAPPAQQDRIQKFHKRFRELQENLADQHMMAERLSSATEFLAQSDQELAAALQQKAIVASRFLYDKAPKPPEAPTTLFEKEWQPTHDELISWERYERAVREPQTVLDDLTNGKLTHEAADSLRTVYPRMYQDIVSELIERLPEIKTKLHYSQRIQLGILLPEVPTDPTLQPSFVLSVQSGYNLTNQEKSSAPTVRPRSGQIKIDTETYLTRGQKLAL